MTQGDSLKRCQRVSKGRFYFQGVQILNDDTLEKLPPNEKTGCKQMMMEEKSLKLEAED